MSRMDKREVEDLARALAHHNRRRWQTMPARANPASDANGGREAWLRRAQIILEAVDTAMTLALAPGPRLASNRSKPTSTSIDPGRARSVASFLAAPWEGHQAFAVHVAELDHRPPSTPAFNLSVPCWS